MSMGTKGNRTQLAIPIADFLHFGKGRVENLAFRPVAVAPPQESPSAGRSERHALEIGVVFLQLRQLLACGQFEVAGVVSVPAEQEHPVHLQGEGETLKLGVSGLLHLLEELEGAVGHAAASPEPVKAVELEERLFRPRDARQDQENRAQPKPMDDHCHPVFPESELSRGNLPLFRAALQPATNSAARCATW
jgi:hypothetical protein